MITSSAGARICEVPKPQAPMPQSGKDLLLSAHRTGLLRTAFIESDKHCTPQIYVTEGIIVMRASIVIRTLNEAEHLPDLLKMIARQRTRGLDVETVLIDSGSTDGTVQIAQDHGGSLSSYGSVGHP